MKRRKGVGVFWRKLRGVRVARTHGAALAGLAILAGFGCEASPAPASTSRDSLGVRIVESVSPRWNENSAWWIDEAPLVDLLESGTGEERFFDRVRDVLRAADGRLIVGDGASSEVRMYDASGRFVRRLSGEGDGPGEFRYLAAIVLLRSGRLVAQELAMGGRGAEFDLDSGLVSSFRRPRLINPLRQPATSEFLWGIDDMSALLVARNTPGLQRPLATIVRLSDDRASSQTVATVPGDEVFIATDADAIPLMQRRLHAVPTGDGELVIGTADRLEYSKLDGATGDLRMIARIPGVSLAVSREELDRERRVRLGPDPRPHIREIFELLPEPAERPAYQQVLVDVEGNVWAGEYLGLARRHDPQKWYVWDSSGVWLGIVETPARFELMRVGADEVFGVRRDFNEVESPQVLRLHRGSCTGDVQVQIEDSAGVRIVEYAGVPEVEPPFAIAEEPVYRHGANPGDYEFQLVDAGRLFPDGSAVVAEWYGEVVVLSPDGTTHEVLAKVGEGPGEVISPYSMFVLGQDSVLVPDDRQSRLTLFVGDSVARIVSLPRAQHFGVAGVGSSGELLLMDRFAHRSWVDIEEEWLAGHMTLFDPETGALDTVASYDHVPRQRSGLMRPIIRAVGEVTVAAGRFVYTRSDRPEISWRLPDGTVERIVRWRPEPTLLAEELLEGGEAYNRMIGRLNYGVSDARLEEIIQEDMSRYRAMIGQPIPLFGSPFADADGNVWLPSYRPAYPEEGSPYTVISPDGEWLGQVETPPRFRILDVTGGLVLGVLRDEMDVENVVVYGLVARSSMVR